MHTEKVMMESIWCPEVRRPVSVVAKQSAPIDKSKSVIVAGMAAQAQEQRTVGVALTAANIDEHGQAGPCCMGRACGHWRWGEAALPPDTSGEIEVPNDQTLRRGFCGLSGKPLFDE